MSLGSSVNRNNYVGDDSTATYSYTFKIFVKEDLEVTLTDTLGAITTLAVDANYTVSGAGEPSGGTITLNAGNLATGAKIAIRRVRPLTQDTEFKNQGAFFARNHEDAYDNGTMVDQQQQDELNRSAKVPASIAQADFDPTLPDPSNASNYSKSIVFAADGSGFIAGPSAADIAAAAGAAGSIADINATWLSVRADPYNAVGDGVADDSTPIQDAVDAVEAAGGGYVLFPRGTYNLAGTAININSPGVHVWGIGNGSKIVQANGKVVFKITADDTVVENICIDGTNRVPAAEFPNEFAAIWAQGTNLNKLQRIHVRNCRLINISYYAINMEFVEWSSVKDCSIDTVDRAGIAWFSSKHFQCIGNRIRDVVSTGPSSGPDSNAYGIILTSNFVDDPAPDPDNCNFGVITNNVVEDVSAWTGIDSHYGRNVTISNNVINNCLYSISCQTRDESADTVTETVGQFSITNNICNGKSNTDTTDNGVGIEFFGGPTVHPRGLVIANNTVIGHGDPEDFNTGGIRTRTTIGTVIANNTIHDCKPCGIVISPGNKATSITGNVICDTWTNSVSVGRAVGIRLRGDAALGDQIVCLTGNSFTVDDMSASYVMTAGMYFDDDNDSGATKIGQNVMALPASSLYIEHGGDDEKWGYSSVQQDPFYSGDNLPTLVRKQWNAGDRVINTNTAPFTERGWICAQSSSVLLDPGRWIRDFPLVDIQTGITNPVFLLVNNLSEGDFATHANWDVTGDWDDTAGNARFQFTTTQTSNLTQTGATSPDPGNLNKVIDQFRWHKFTYTVTENVAFDGDGKFYIPSLANGGPAREDILLTHTTGTHTKYFFTDENDNPWLDFRIKCVVGSGSVGDYTWDDFSLIDVTNGDVGDRSWNRVPSKTVTTGWINTSDGWLIMPGGAPIPSSMFTMRRLAWQSGNPNTTSPSTRTAWTIGDTIWNASPSQETPMGFQCAVAGTKHAITGATQANPVVVTTSASHGLSNGVSVYIADVTGMGEINNRTFVVANVAASTFELSGENGTGHSAYTSGGSATWPGVFRKIDSYPTPWVTLSVAGPTDDLNMTAHKQIIVNTSSNDVTLGGIIGGVEGDTISVVVNNSDNKFIIENNEGGGNQSIFTGMGADLTITETGMFNMTFDGNNWYVDKNAFFYKGEVLVSAAGPTDNLDVSGKTYVLMDTSSNDVTIGGFVGGIDGQTLNVVKNSANNSAVLEHNEGTGNQDMLLNGSIDSTIVATDIGGWRLLFISGRWIEVSN